MRLGLRGRTTAGFALVFFLVGAIGVAVGYVVLGEAIDRQRNGPTQTELQDQVIEVAEELGVEPPAFRFDRGPFGGLFPDLAFTDGITIEPSAPVALAGGEFALDVLVGWLETNIPPELIAAQPPSVVIASPESPAEFDRMILGPLLAAADQDSQLFDDFVEFTAGLETADGTLLFPTGIQLQGELCDLSFDNCEAALDALMDVPTESEFLAIGQIVTEAVNRANERARQDTLSSYLQISTALLIVTTALGTTIGWLMSHRMLRPVREVTAAANAASADSLSNRIDHQGPDDELHQLADTFDEMLDRLQRSFDAQRRFSANAAHELKTPIAVIRAELDAATSDPDATDREVELAARLEHAVERSTTTVDALLALAHAQGAQLDRSAVDVSALVGELAVQHTSWFTDRGVNLDLTLPPAGENSMIEADATLVERAVTNLLENAAHYAPASSVVSVAVAIESTSISITVRNAGNELAPETVARLVEPHQRANGRVGDGGHGLGLTIVAAIAEAHEATLSLAPRSGGGLVAKLTFPVAELTRPVARSRT